MVAAEMDFYPKYLPWAFVTPSVAGAREDGKLLIDLPWDGEASRFADVIGAVVLYIEEAKQTSDEGPAALSSIEMRVDLLMVRA